MAERVTVEGLARFRLTLAAAKHRIAEPEAALTASGRLVEQRGRSGAPVASGSLARSLASIGEPTAVTVQSALPYAAVTEYGGGNNIPAQPFLRPALANSQPLIEKEFWTYAETALHMVKGI